MQIHAPHRNQLDKSVLSLESVKENINICK